MKKTIISSLFIFLVLFLSACSQMPQRSKVNTTSNSQRPIQTSQQRSQALQVKSPQAQQYNPARQRMINIAGSTLGAPYRWGGDNPKSGFDCSGLMTYVHKNALGKKIPRTTAKQRDQSRSIRYAQLQPGDMLFFKTGRKTNHVGIYIGNRKFIHAPSGGKRVTVAKMDSSYWHKRFVKFGTFL